MGTFKLLDKHEIDRQKADERKRDVDEGAKLARNIDELRRLEADERKRITGWRDGTLATVKLEIEQAVKERDGIRQEIKVVKAQTDKLREPLDAEWEAVRQEKAKNKAIQSDLDLTGTTLTVREVEIAHKEREIEVDKGRIDDMKRMSAGKLIDAGKTLTKAHEESASMRNKAQILLSRAELSEKLLTERELAIAIKERDATNRAERVDKYESRLFIKEQQLKEWEQVLLATVKELDGQSHPKRSTKERR